MIFVAGKPMIQHVIEALSRNGIRDIIIVVGHRKERICDFIGSGESLGVTVRYVIQERQLGSADALSCAQKYADEAFFVLAGNKFIGADTLVPIINAVPLSMLVKTVSDPPRSSIVTIKNGKLEAVFPVERRPASTLMEKGNFTIDTRVYSLDRNVFAFLEDAPSIISALETMMKKGMSVDAVETEGEWSDLIYPWDILPVNGAILRHLDPGTSGKIGPNVYLQGNVNIGDSGVISPNCVISGPVIIGPGCKIGPHASLNGPLSIGANTQIESFAYVTNSVIGRDVHIATGAIIEDSVIDDGTYIGARFTSVTGEADIRLGSEHYNQKFGCMIGEGCQLGTGIISNPGTIIGNFCRVDNLKVLSGDIPDKSLVV
jgi:glucose-1-phosphate thymidylyltransferase